MRHHISGKRRNNYKGSGLKMSLGKWQKHQRVPCVWQAACEYTEMGSQVKPYRKGQAIQNAQGHKGQTIQNTQTQVKSLFGLCPLEVFWTSGWHKIACGFSVCIGPMRLTEVKDGTKIVGSVLGGCCKVLAFELCCLMVIFLYLNPTHFLINLESSSKSHKTITCYLLEGPATLSANMRYGTERKGYTS